MKRIILCTLFVLIGLQVSAQTSYKIPIEFYINDTKEVSDSYSINLCEIEFRNEIPPEFLDSIYLSGTLNCPITIFLDSLSVSFNDFSLWTLLELPQDNSVIIRYYAGERLSKIIDVPAIERYKKGHAVKSITTVYCSMCSEMLVHYEE